MGKEILGFLKVWRFVSCIVACMVFVFCEIATARADSPSFSVTTTSVSSFLFKISAIGTFTVDCGDSGTLSGVVNNVCTYTTTCNTGYSNIQNGGSYNVSCSANTVNITWRDASGNTITTNTCAYDDTITLPDNPTKKGYKFTGWMINTD